MDVCPQCKCTVKNSNSRLIQDACGHKKCRLCLLIEEDGCRTCSETAKGNCDSNKSFFDPKEDTLYEKSVEIQQCPIKSGNNEQLIVELKSLLNGSKKEENETNGDKWARKKNKPKNGAVKSSNDAKVDEGKKKVSKNKPLLPKDHVLVIQGDSISYKCTICKKSFTSKLNIRYHNYCGSENKPFQCELCGKGFVIRSHYEYHQRVHSGDQPFVCDTCGKGFKQKGKLVRHIKSHTGERPFMCQACGRGFVNYNGLRSHERVHTGERPYACNSCGKKFGEYSNYMKHLQVHSGQKPYMCEECGRSFTFKWGLEGHQLCHSRVRPFACDSCSRAFSSRKDLRRHAHVHSLDRPHSCLSCNIGFRRRDNLERHMKNTHPETRPGANPQRPLPSIENGTSVIQEKSSVNQKSTSSTQDSQLVLSTLPAPLRTNESDLPRILEAPPLRIIGIPPPEVMKTPSLRIVETVTLPSRIIEAAKPRLLQNTLPRIVEPATPRIVEHSSPRITDPIPTRITEPSIIRVQKTFQVPVETYKPVTRTSAFRPIIQLNNPNIKSTLKHFPQPKQKVTLKKNSLSNPLRKNKKQIGKEVCAPNTVPVPVPLPQSHLEEMNKLQTQRIEAHPMNIVSDTQIPQIQSSETNHIVKLTPEIEPKKPVESYRAVPVINRSSKIISNLAQKSISIESNNKTEPSNYTKEVGQNSEEGGNHVRTITRASDVLKTTQNVPTIVALEPKVKFYTLNKAIPPTPPPPPLIPAVPKPRQTMLRKLLSDVKCVDDNQDRASTQEISSSNLEALVQDMSRIIGSTRTNSLPLYDPKLPELSSPDLLLNSRDIFRSTPSGAFVPSSPFMNSDYDKRLCYSDDFSVDSQIRTNYYPSSVYDSWMDSSYIVDDVRSDRGALCSERGSTMNNTCSMIDNLTDYSRFDQVSYNPYSRGKEIAEKRKISADVAGTKDCSFSVPPVGQPVIVGARKGSNNVICPNFN